MAKKNYGPMSISVDFFPGGLLVLSPQSLLRIMQYSGKPILSHNMQIPKSCNPVQRSYCREHGLARVAYILL